MTDAHEKAQAIIARNVIKAGCLPPTYSLHVGSTPPRHVLPTMQMWKEQNDADR